MKNLTKLVGITLVSMGMFASTQVLASPVVSGATLTPSTVSPTSLTAVYTFTLTPNAGETVTAVTGLASGTGSTSCAGTTAVTCTYTYNPAKRPIRASDLINVEITYTTRRSTSPYKSYLAVPVNISVPAASVQ